MKYEVKWKKIWLSLTKYMSFGITIPLAGLLILKWISSGFDYAETFKHISLLGALGLILGCWAFSAILAFLMAIWFKLAYVKLENDAISGLNYWGKRITLPLSKLESIDGFSDSGINAVVANGGSHGKVFIYLHTEGIEEILRILESHLPGRNEH